MNSRAKTLLIVVLSIIAIWSLRSVSFAESGGTSGLKTGIYHGRVVTYALVDNRAIYEGDIILEHVDEQLQGSADNLNSPTQPKTVGVAYPASLWPKVGSVFNVPYIITNGSANLSTAISQFNSTFAGFIQWVPRTAETDYVNISLDPLNLNGICESSVGRIGGEQSMGGSASCSVGTLLHEMGHTIGLWHEQSRSDRDTYVTVNYGNVIKGSRSNFDQLMDNAQNLTLYDYASIMHYIPFAFTRNGGPTIESIPAGIPLSNQSGYTAGDIDGIGRLYGAAPNQVTVDSNPPGLSVIVDGATVTTPQKFTWTLNSTHTLDVVSGSQTIGGVTYTFGRWNDGSTGPHSVTVTPGNGLLTQPANLPAVTTLTANFIQLTSYSDVVFPTGSGTVVPSPPPLSYPPAAGSFYVARQQATLTATPSTGQSFYAFINSPFWLPGGLGANPKTFFVMDDGTQINLTTEFTNTPVTSITVNPEASNLGVLVDGGFWYAPKNFTPQFDSGWNAGTTHSVSIDSPQLPYSVNSRYAFSSWSDAGAQTHNIVAPSANMVFSANVTPEFAPVDLVNQGCAGSIAVSPGSPTGDGFYPLGSLLSFSETVNSGWTFTGWQFDLSGTQNPDNLTVSDEELVAADYNTQATPLSISSLSPAAAVTGGSSFPLTINGAGFTSGSLVFINNAFRASTFNNSNTLTVNITSADLANAGAFQVFVENFPTGATCAASAAKPFFVASSQLLTPSPSSITFTNQAVGTTSAASVTTLKNNTTSAIAVSSIKASGSFTQTNNCPGSLNPGTSCTVSVQFSPANVGPISGAVTVTDNSPDSPQLVVLKGAGVAALSISPAKLSFGTVPVGTTSATLPVAAINNTAATLSLSFSSSANYTAFGAGTTPCGTSLGAKAACTIAVRFKPVMNGVANGALTVSYGGRLSPVNIPLSGSGSGGGSGSLTFSPSSVTFINAVGTTSPAKLITVTNSTGASLTISSFRASGNFAATRSGTTPCGGPLAASATCAVGVMFSPTVPGIIQGAVSFIDTAASPQPLPLQGTAILPLSLSPSPLTFGPQTVGTTSAVQTATLTNYQNIPVTLNSILASADFTAVAGGATPCGASLSAGGHCTLNTNFTPSLVGTVPGAITVNYGTSGQQSFVLSGTGQ
jgi:hypothetical protein